MLRDPRWPRMVRVLELFTDETQRAVESTRNRPAGGAAISSNGARKIFPAWWKVRSIMKGRIPCQPRLVLSGESLPAGSPGGTGRGGRGRRDGVRFVRRGGTFCPGFGRAIPRSDRRRIGRPEPCGTCSSTPNALVLATFERSRAWWKSSCKSRNARPTSSCWIRRERVWGRWWFAGWLHYSRDRWCWWPATRLRWRAILPAFWRAVIISLRMAMVDLFPQTYHLESVVLLQRP